MAELHFLRPIWFFAYIPLIVLLLVFFIKIKSVKTKHQSAWKNEVDAHLLDHVLISFLPPQTKKTGYPVWMLVAFFWAISVLALAGPSWDKTAPMQIIPDIAPLVVVLDLSHSMQVRDVYPNRLKHAQYKLRTLIDKMINRPIALVVFSAQAHSVIPLTRDARLVTHLLEYMTADIMPAPGSNRSAGLQLAANILSQNKSRNKTKKGHILLITDGLEDHAVSTIQQLAAQHLDVLIYVVATQQGGTIPETENGDSLTDNGKDFSALQESGLIQLAQNDLAYYEIVTNDNKDILNLLSQLNDFFRSYIDSSYTASSYLNEDETEQQTIQVWRDRGVWLIFLLLPLALMMFRPGFMSVLLPFPIAAAYIYAVLFFYPVTAEATSWKNSWQNIWYNSNTQGYMALADNDPKLAEQLFSEPFWRAVAQYRQQKFTQALKNFSRINTAEGFYNKANTLVHLKRYKEAMAAYHTALQMNSSLTEASYNLRLVKQFYQQTQANETSEINAFNRPKNIKDTKPLKPLEQLTNQSDKSPNNIQEQKQPQKQGQDKKSVNKVDKNSSVKGNIKGSTASRSKGQNNNEKKIPDKIEQAEKAGKLTKQNNNKTQEHKKRQKNNSKTISKLTQNVIQNKVAQEKVTQAKARQKINKVSQVNSNKPLTSSEALNQQQKNKANLFPEPDSLNSRNKLKSSDKQQGKKNKPSKSEAIEITEDETNQRVDLGGGRVGSGKQTISRQQLRHKLSREKDEQFQSLQHWLDSIKDDPTELLREKFKREYKRASSFSGMDQK